MTSIAGVTGLIICCLELPVLGLNTTIEEKGNFPYSKVFSSKRYYEEIELMRKAVAYYSIVPRNS
jgi:hypothetical protein